MLNLQDLVLYLLQYFLILNINLIAKYFIHNYEANSILSISGQVESKYNIVRVTKDYQYQSSCRQQNKYDSKIETCF